MCPGCEWLRAEVAERRRLADEFSQLGQKRLAEIAEEGMSYVRLDWAAHIHRDHPEFNAPLLALSRAIGERPEDLIVHRGNALTPRAELVASIATSSNVKMLEARSRSESEARA
jgi:hypothetical protein